MKEISVVCKPVGIATVTVAEEYISNENNATKIEFDFTAMTDYLGLPKWVDLILSNNTSLRYDLGVSDSPELELGNIVTFKGKMIITPFILDTVNDIKVKFKSSDNVYFYNQVEAGEEVVALRDDYIVSLVDRIEQVEEDQTHYDYDGELAVDGTFDLVGAIEHEHNWIHVKFTKGNKAHNALFETADFHDGEVMTSILRTDPTVTATLTNNAGTVTFTSNDATTTCRINYFHFKEDVD